MLMNLTRAACGFFIGQGQMQMITKNIFIFTNCSQSELCP